MDEQSLSLLRIFGYLLNAAIFAATIIKWRYHAKVLGAWLVWFGVVIVAVLFRLVGEVGTYFVVVDYFVTTLLYVCAVFGAWVYLRETNK